MGFVVTVDGCEAIGGTHEGREIEVVHRAEKLGVPGWTEVAESAFVGDVDL